MATATGSTAASATISSAARRLTGTLRRVAATNAPMVPVIPSASMISGSLSTNKCGK